MCDKTENDRIRKEIIKENIEVTSIIEKMMKNRVK